MKASETDIAPNLRHSVLSNNVEDCQRLLLNALQYGTAADNNEQARNDETCKITAGDVWQHIVVVAVEVGNHQSMEVLQDTIVDCLWLVSSALFSAASRTTADPLQNTSIQALISIIK
jgi:hypothetical protein